ncbi:MAG TPA: hypothetical protein VLH12_08600 [Usitatibacter sp.]|nr:hypothetical protein [Usitatibacter sp.]
MTRLLAALLLCYASLAAPAPIVWVKISEPMSQWIWAQVETPAFIENSCKSDTAFPRVCLYRFKGLCRIITLVPPKQLEPEVIYQLERMCTGYFPEYPQGGIPFRREFSDPNYLPNQAPPAVDPAWQYQAKEKP